MKPIKLKIKKVTLRNLDEAVLRTVAGAGVVTGSDDNPNCGGGGGGTGAGCYYSVNVYCSGGPPKTSVNCGATYQGCHTFCYCVKPTNAGCGPTQYFQGCVTACAQYCQG